MRLPVKQKYGNMQIGREHPLIVKRAKNKTGKCESETEIDVDFRQRSKQGREYERQ